MNRSRRSSSAAGELCFDSCGHRIRLIGDRLLVRRDNGRLVRRCSAEETIALIALFKTGFHCPGKMFRYQKTSVCAERNNLGTRVTLTVAMIGPDGVAMFAVERSDLGDFKNGLGRIYGDLELVDRCSRYQTTDANGELRRSDFQN